MVLAVTTSANGVITVQPDATALGVTLTPANDTITLTPYMNTTNTTALNVSAANSDQGKQIVSWKCIGSTALISKYLPGSCK